MTDVRFSAEDWARIRRDWSAWWDGQIDRPMIIIRRMDPARAKRLPQAPGFVPQLPLEEMTDEQVVDRYQAQIEATDFYGDAWPKWWINFGPGALAAWLGARTHVDANTVWFEPPDTAESTGGTVAAATETPMLRAGETPAIHTGGTPVLPGSPIERLELPYRDDRPWWRRVRGLTATAVRRWGDSINVSYTDIGGNADVLASFLTTQALLTALCDAPEHVDRLARQVTAAWLRYYDELGRIILPAGAGTTPWAPIWSPRRCYMLQSDFCYMISPAMFERFVLPDLEACCAGMEHGFYHLDGKGQLVHLDMLLSIRRLRGVQWIPGAGQPQAEQWPDVLARIRRAGKLCQVYTDAPGAMRIVRELGGAGFAIEVGGLSEPRQIREFLADIQRESRRRTKPEW